MFSALLPQHALLFRLATGCVIGLVAPLGDLIVSVLKRDMGVKDSGSLIPGHGGVLDRCGSFVLACPTFYYMLRLGDLLGW